MNKVLVAYSPVRTTITVQTATGTTQRTTIAFELNNEPETWANIDTRVITEVEYANGKFAELRIGGEFMHREPITGEWFDTDLVQGAMRMCGYHR